MLETGGGSGAPWNLPPQLNPKTQQWNTTRIILNIWCETMGSWKKHYNRAVLLDTGAEIRPGLEEEVQAESIGAITGNIKK